MKLDQSLTPYKIIVAIGLLCLSLSCSSGETTSKKTTADRTGVEGPDPTPPVEPQNPAEESKDSCTEGLFPVDIGFKKSAANTLGDDILASFTLISGMAAGIQNKVSIQRNGQLICEPTPNTDKFSKKTLSSAQISSLTQRIAAQVSADQEPRYTCRENVSHPDGYFIQFSRDGELYTSSGYDSELFNVLKEACLDPISACAKKRRSLVEYGQDIANDPTILACSTNADCTMISTHNNIGLATGSQPFLNHQCKTFFPVAKSALNSAKIIELESMFNDLENSCQSTGCADPANLNVNAICFANRCSLNR